MARARLQRVHHDLRAFVALHEAEQGGDGLARVGAGGNVACRLAHDRGRLRALLQHVIEALDLVAYACSGTFGARWRRQRLLDGLQRGEILRSAPRDAEQAAEESGGWAQLTTHASGYGPARGQIGKMASDGESRFAPARAAALQWRVRYGG